MVSRPNGYTRGARIDLKGCKNNIILTDIFRLKEILRNLPINPYALNEPVLADLSKDILGKIQRIYFQNEGINNERREEQKSLQKYLAWAPVIGVSSILIVILLIIDILLRIAPSSSY